MQAVLALSYPAWVCSAGLFYLVSYALVDWLARSRHASRAISAQARRPSRIELTKTLLFHGLIFLQIGGSMYAGFALHRHGLGNFYLQTPSSPFSWLRIAVESLLILFFIDTTYYWVHRGLHENRKVYKWLHREHHRALYPTAWVTLHQHPLELFLAATLPNALIYLFPVNCWSFLIACAMKHFIDVAGHAGVELSGTLETLIFPNGLAHFFDPRRSGIARAFNCVTHHDLHHQQFQGNYSLYFTFWDELCGTALPDSEAVYAAAIDEPGGESAPARS